jgi:hypothetical protein
MAPVPIRTAAGAPARSRSARPLVQQGRADRRFAVVYPLANTGAQAHNVGMRRPDGLSPNCARGLHRACAGCRDTCHPDPVTTSHGGPIRDPRRTRDLANRVRAAAGIPTR